MGKKDPNDPLSERPSDSDFLQQNLKSWQHIISPSLAVKIFVVASVVYSLLGILVLLASFTAVELEQAYPDLSNDKDKNLAWVSFDIKENMEPPIFLHYRLTNYFQSVRRYVKSRSDPMNRGELDRDSYKTCQPDSAERNEKDQFYYPCGLVARSTFNDTFHLSLNNGQPIEHTGKGIAWASDVERKFKNVGSSLDTTKFTRFDANNRTLPSIDDEDFMVWMRTAGTPNFKKLKYIINTPLKRGDTVEVVIESRFPVASFGGTKSVSLSTESWMGPKNIFLGICYCITGLFSLIMAISMYTKNRISPRPLGDIKWFRVGGASKSPQVEQEQEDRNADENIGHVLEDISDDE